MMASAHWWKMNVTHLSIRSVQNTIDTRETLEWRCWREDPSDPSVSEGPSRWGRLPPTETKKHKGKAMSSA